MPHQPQGRPGTTSSRPQPGAPQAGQGVEIRFASLVARVRRQAMRVGLRWARMSVSTRARPLLEPAAAAPIASARCR